MHVFERFSEDVGAACPRLGHSEGVLGGLRRIVIASSMRRSLLWPRNGASGDALANLSMPSPVPVFCEDVISFLHDRMARKPALGVVPLRVAGVNVSDAAS